MADEGATPYAEGAGQYWSAGWRGVVPVRGKFPPRTGLTGHNGADPSWPDVMAYMDEPDGYENIALRMPATIIGIDVDAYKGGSLAEREQQWGPLPPTWKSTSRDDGSGIFLYRVPPGLAWPGQVADSVETVHRGHRYAMVWPSIHPSGKTYRWVDPQGLISLLVPRPESLPELPDGWVAGLSTGAYNPDAKADLGAPEAASWVDATNVPMAMPCGPLAMERDELLTAISGAGSRHDATRDGVLALVRLADQGHVGLGTALDQVRSQFIAVVGSERQGAAGEFARLLTGAVQICSASPDWRARRDPCIPPVSSFLATEWGVRSTTPIVAGSAAAVLSDDPDATAGAPQVGTELALLGIEAPLVSTWKPVLLAEAVKAIEDAAAPTELARSDGQCLFYPGAVNGVIGASESGKTWIALEAARQALLAGRKVAILDFEDTAVSIKRRLLALGVDEERFADAVVYAQPLDSPTREELLDLVTELKEFEPSLIIVDGMNAAMSIMDLDLSNNKDATRFFQLLLRPLAETGAAVVYVDHITKNANEAKGGIGAQAKRAMTTGVTLRVDVDEQFDRIRPGTLKLTVDKDRAGHVRAASGPEADAGTAHVVPDGQGKLAIKIILETAEQPNPVKSDEPREVTMRRGIMAFLDQMLGTAQSQTQIEKAVPGRVSDLREQIAWLVENGYIDRRPARINGREAAGHWAVMPYSPVPMEPIRGQNPFLDPRPDPVPVPNGGVLPVPTPSPTTSGRGEVPRPSASSASPPPRPTPVPPFRGGREGGGECKPAGSEQLFEANYDELNDDDDPNQE